MIKFVCNICEKEGYNEYATLPERWWECEKRGEGIETQHRLHLCPECGDSIFEKVKK